MLRGATCGICVQEWHPKWCALRVTVPWKEHSSPGRSHLGAPALAILLQEGGPLPGPETGLLSNTQKWIVQGDTCACKARDFIGKGRPGGEQEGQGQGTQENCSAIWLAVSGFMVTGLVSRLSLANHSDSESFLVVHALFSRDGCQREGFWEVWTDRWCLLLTFWTLLVGKGLLVPCSLPGTSCCKTTHANSYYGAWPGWAISISVLPLTIP